MVLAIIALIAVPIVLNIIEKSRQGAAITSARNYIKATGTYVVSSELDKNNKYNVTKDTIIESKNYLKTNDLVSLKGNKPTGLDDYIIIGETKQVIEALLTINGYEILIKDDKVITVIKGEKIAVESINLNKTKDTMEIGSTFTLEAIFKPENASDQRVKYTSSNEEIVTVTEEGVVTAKNIGTAKVIVTSIDDTSKKAECEIEVIASATGLKIEPTESEIVVGEKVTLIGLIEPSDATTSSLTWTTSDINIANVDENGVVTGISKGEAVITATTVNGIKATANITVYKTELLITKVKVGDYVAYDAGVWTETKARPTSQGEFGGYTKGEKKANSSYFGDNVLTNLKGWRVLKIEGNIVTIIHAGVSEYYYHAYGYTSESLAILNSRAISEYLNPIYATSAHILTYEEAIAITGSG